MGENLTHLKNTTENLFLSPGNLFQLETCYRRKISPAKLPRYNLSYLNDCAVGICPAELIVIGADTGMGKTSMANHLAISNAANGLKTYLFSLEGHRYDVIARWKWNVICREYFKRPDGRDMSYQKYLMNLISVPHEIEEIARIEIEGLNDFLHIFSRSVSLDIETLYENLAAASDAQLIVIDHLHYFNMLDDKTEAENISQIMRIIKNLTETNNIPIVLVSHLRKKEKKRGLPDNEDFMGSSNIAKIASTCILLSSDSENHDLVNGRYSTIMRVSKSRTGVSSTLAGQVMFDTRLGIYESQYQLGRVIGGDFKELEPGEYPKWANLPTVII